MIIDIQIEWQWGTVDAQHPEKKHINTVNFYNVNKR